MTPFDLNNKLIPPSHKVKYNASKAESLEEVIWRENRVRCQVNFEKDHVGVRAESFSDFILARAALKGRVSLPILRAIG